MSSNPRCSPKLVQDFLGHSSIKTTLDTYSHVMPTIHGEAIRKLDEILDTNDASARSEEGEPSAA